MMLVKCFLGGFIICSIGALILELGLGQMKHLIEGNFLQSFYNAYFVAAGCEEALKWIILYWIIWKSKYFDEHYDGIIYAVFVSLGFALLENLLYVYSGGLGVALLRAFMAVPGHGFFAVAMGYYLSLAKFGEVEKRKSYLIKSFFVPLTLHGTYDFILMYTSGLKNPHPIIIIAMLISMTVFVIYLWRQGIKKINEHVQLGQQTAITQTENHITN